MNQFLLYLESLSPLSDAAIYEIKNVAEKYTLSKKQLFIPELSKAQHLYFIERGAVRAFYLHHDKEVTDWIGAENMIIGPIVRNFPIKNTKHSVEALEECTVIRISFADLEILYNSHHDVERLGRIIAIQTIIHLQHKIDCLQLCSAKERYEDFKVRFPHLINRIPLGYISSYLGMNQVTLSRIRKAG